MSVTINSFGQIARRLGIQKGGPANAHLTELCYKKMDRFVPMSALDSRTHLRTNVFMTNKSITYQSVYAKYQYYGKRSDGSHAVNPANYTTPGTGPYWDQRMLSVETKDIVNKMNKYIQKFGAD